MAKNGSDMNNPMRIVTAGFVGATALIIGLGIGQMIDERSTRTESAAPRVASASPSEPAAPAEQVPEAASAAEPQAASPQATTPTPPDDQQPSAEAGTPPEPQRLDQPQQPDQAQQPPAQQPPEALQTPGESAPVIVPMQSERPTATPNDGASAAAPPADQQSQTQPQAQAEQPAAPPPAATPPAADQSGGSGLAAQVAAADPAAGEALSRRCVACHTFTKGGAKKIGPNLWGVVGRDVGSVEGFNYSADFGTIDGVWTLDRLAAYIQKPKEVIPSTRMIFPGFRSDDELHNLLAYLTTLTDRQSAIDAPKPAATPAAALASPAPAASPAPVQQVADTAGAQPAAAPPTEDYFGADWPQGEGRDFVGNMCGACHSLAIVKQQRLPREEWDKLLDWMVSEQGMPPLEPDERKTVLDYLTTHFGRG